MNTVTDTTALQERIEAALIQATVDGAERTEEYAAAVLPIIAAEVRAAKAEALKGAARDMGEWADEGIVVVGEYDEDSWAELTVGEWLNARATEYETGDRA